MVKFFSGRNLWMCLGVALIVLMVPLQAQDFPSRPIKIVLPAPPGGSGDAVLRAIMPRMSERLGQPIVLENRPGAGGNMAMDFVAKSTPDGYTLAVGPAGPLTVNQYFYPDIPFDASRAFAPIGSVAMTPFVLVGFPGFAPRTLADVLAEAKRQPGKITAAHPGNGTAMHLSLALLEHKSGTSFLQVPYKGVGPTVTDVVAGHAQLALVDLPSVMTFVQSGRLIAYAVTTDRRVSALPQVPTMAEAGVPGYESSGWFGLVAPAGTPAPTIAKLHAALADALSQPAFREKAESVGVEPRSDTSAEFGRFIAQERKKWAEVLKPMNPKVN